MNLKLVIPLLLVIQLTTVYGNPWAIVPIATSIISGIVSLAATGKSWSVEVHNNGKHHAHLWCASKDDKIGGDDGIWVPPGEKLVWGFRPNLSTQFWCNMDWYGQRVGWDVYVNNWRDAPNPTKWSIRDDGVYDQWKNRRWREYNS